MEKRRTRVGKITEDQFQSVQMLKRANVTAKVIANTLGLGRSTVNMLRKFGTLEEYRTYVDDYSRRNNEKRRALLSLPKATESKPIDVEALTELAEKISVEEETSPEPQLYGDLLKDILEEIRRTNKLLVSFSNQGTQESKGWFRR